MTLPGAMFYFNPPAPCGAGRAPRPAGSPWTQNFNPPAPCGAGHCTDRVQHGDTGFQSTRPVRGGTVCCGKPHPVHRISIHPPRAGRDVVWYGLNWSFELFQSTRPVRGGTRHNLTDGQAGLISIHPPRAGRDAESGFELLARIISIHPPRAGRDIHATGPTPGCWNFNPPAPCGAGRGKRPHRGLDENFNPPAPCGAGLPCRGLPGGCREISIHPPRAGRDFQTGNQSPFGDYFNPPAPCGAGLLLR